MADSTSALAPGTVFHERYRIVRPIKTGGMGEVYEALDLRTSRPCALKVMLAATLSNEDQRSRFEQEARVTGAIDSEHVVRISDAGVDGDRPFLVMELLRGEELQTLLDRARVLPVGEVLLYLSQVARALEKTHAQQIIHRDLKPENLFVARRDDGSPCVKILDFGIAKIAAASQAKQTRSLGTPLFMAPEQVLGEGSIGPNADLYALGHVAYCLLAGEPYWTEEAEGHDSILPLLKKVLAGPVEPATARAMRRRNVALPVGFDAWFARAAAADPSQRFDGPTAQIDALRAVLLPAIGAQGGVSPAASSLTMRAAGADRAAAITSSPASRTTGAAMTVAAPPMLTAPTVVPLPTYAPASTAAVAPPPLAAVPPKRSGPSPVLLAVAGVGVLAVAAGGGVLGYLATRDPSPTPSSSARVRAAPSTVVASAPPTPTPTPVTPQPIPSCWGEKCAPLVANDPSAVDPNELLAQLTKLAQLVAPDGEFLSYTVATPTASGLLDMRAKSTATAIFRIGGELLNVMATTGQLVATRNPSTMPGPALPAPCPYKTAFAAASPKLGGKTPTQVSYSYLGDKAVWLFVYGSESVFVDGATCALTSLY